MNKFFAAIKQGFKRMDRSEKDSDSLEKSHAIMHDRLKYKDPRNVHKPVSKPNLRMHTRSQQKT